MSNFAPDDIHRSLRRYAAQALDGWTVRTQRSEVKDTERPLAVVEPASPITTTFARATVPQGDVSKVQAFSVMAYPALGDTPNESRLAASQVQQLLDAIITRGMVDDDGASIAPPLRIPIYDYDGVPVVGAGRAGPVAPYGWAWVEDHSANIVQDPLDHLRFTVPLDVRLSWAEAGRRVPDAPIVARVIPEPHVQ